MILSTVRLARPVSDVKVVHDWVIQAALAGEPVQPVLWAQPAPSLLLVRHDRGLTVTDFPPKAVDSVTHRPYWLPAAGQRVDWAVIVDAAQSGQTTGQWRTRNAVNAAAGRGVRDAPKPRRIRTPGQMVEVVTGRLAPVMDVTGADPAWHRPRKGLRGREGRVMWSNQVLVRGAGRVTDEPGLQGLMREGIGRGRSFGCGLLLARPATGDGGAAW